MIKSIDVNINKDGISVCWDYDGVNVRKSYMCNEKELFINDLGGDADGFIELVNWSDIKYSDDMV